MNLAAGDDRVRSALADLLAGELAETARLLEERGAAAPTVADTLLDTLLGTLAVGGDEIPLDLALHARLCAERLQRQGVGLDTLLELAMGVETAIKMSGRRAPRKLAQLTRALVLLLTRGYMEVEADQHEEQKAELRALIRVARAVGRTLDVYEVAEAGLRETVKAMQLDGGAIWQVRDGSARPPQLVLAATIGLSEHESRFLAQLDLLGRQQVAAAVRRGVPLQLDQVEDGMFGPYQSALVVPLGQGRSLSGMLVVLSRHQRSFAEVEVSFIGAVGDHVALALEHSLTHLREAHTDYLTGLSNRSEFEREVRRSLALTARHGRPLTLMLMDMDGLKAINDSHGHHAGDEAIRAVADVIRGVVRTSDVSARLGGDEFGVAMPDAAMSHASEVADRVRRALPGHLEISFGLAEWKSGLDYGALFEAADQLLYREKRRHRARRARAAKLRVLRQRQAG